ncbi:MAG: hypothetical protein AB8H86_02800 [Polyangiales bacterium]
MRHFGQRRVAIAAVALLALCAAGSEGTAQDGAVLVTEGVGPRAAAGLRRDLSRRWNRPVHALHEQGASTAPHFVSVSVRGGQVFVQYRSGSTIRTGQASAGTRRARLVQTVMAAVEGTEAVASDVGESAEPVEARGPQSTGGQSEMIGTTLIALDAELSVPSAPSAMRTSDGVLLGLVDESSPGQVLLATEADQVEASVGRVRAESAAGVVLAIE